MTVTTQQRYREILQQGQTRALELLYRDHSLEEICTAIIESIERIDEGVFCSVLRLNPQTRTLHKIAAPNLPDFYNDAIEGMKIGKGIGSCGAAAFSKGRVIITDILTHPYWEKARNLVKKTTLRSCWSQPILDSRGRVLATFAIYYDKPRQPELFELKFIESAADLVALTINHKRAEERLRRNEARQRAIIENITDVIAIIDQEGKNTFRSTNIERLFGWNPEEVFGASTWDNIHPDDLEETKSIFASLEGRDNASVTNECRYQCKDGSFKWIEYTAVNCLKNPDISGILISYHDITERKRMILEQKRSAQLAALGTVAAGVAHEINNPIQGIMNYATIIHQAPDKTAQVGNISGRIIKESIRIATLTQDLLSCSKNASQEKVASDFNALIDSALTLVGTKLNQQGVALETTFAENLPKVAVQPQNIQQVVINLIDNASDAISAKKLIKEKRIQVKTFVQDFRDRAEICLEVFDRGIGMSSATLEQAKETFFSTKPSSQGTGLGLSIVSDIVDSHNGRMELESLEGEFTSVRVCLPAEPS
ncbi:MAG: PAS domain S-box protein [Desulfuromonadales bacterium]|nr:PAS domain S-box protein [Desulfuromonadales bacterium]